MAMKSKGPLSRYVYPDIGDALTAKMISANEPYPGYWASSEKLVLDRLRERLAAAAGGKMPRRFLDAGCGEGRLLPVFCDLFDSVVAVDPDPARLATAVKDARRLGLAHKITFKQITIEELQVSEPFDFVLCSHIIQHVHTKSLPQVLGALASVLAPGGCLALLTGHSTSTRDQFFKDMFDKGGVHEVPITLREFNSLVTSQVGTLPIHFFTKSSLKALLAKHGLAVADLFCFHCFGDFGALDDIVHRDRIVNALPELQARFGRDIFVAATFA